MRRGGFRRPRRAGGARELGGEPAEPDRVHRPRPALVPRQPAVLALSRLCPGLKFVSRCQLLFAILMFLGSPGWIGLLIVGTLALAFDRHAGRLHPRRRRHCDLRRRADHVVCAEDRDRRQHPDARATRATRLAARCASLASVATETIFFILLVADHVVRPCAVDREPAVRPPDRMGRTGARRPFGLARAGHRRVLAAYAAGRRRAGAAGSDASRARLPYALFLAGGLALSIPLAVITALPATGRLLTRCGIGRLPEETAPPGVAARARIAGDRGRARLARP